MSKGLIVVTKPGLYLPKAMEDKITAEFRTRMGYATVYDDGSLEMMSLNLGPDEYNIPQAIKEVQDSHHTNGLMFHMLDAPDGIAEEDQQPYPVLSDGDKVLIAAAIDSECTNYAKEDLFTPEWHMCKDFLAEFCSDLFIEVGGELSKLYDVLDSAKNRKAIGNVLVPRGALTILLANPDKGKRIITFQNKNDLQIDAKEFWASRSLNVSEKPIDVKVPDTPPKKETLIEKLKREKAEKAAAAAPGTGPQPEVHVDPAIGSKALPSPQHETETMPKTPPTLNEQRVVSGTKGIPAPTGVLVPEGHILVALRNGGPIIVPKDTKLMEPPADAYGKALGRWFDRNFGFKPDNFASERNALPAYMLKGSSPLRDFVHKSFGMLAFRKPDQSEEDLKAELEKIEEQKKAQESRVTTGGSTEVPLFVPPRAAKEIRAKLMHAKPQGKDEIEASLAKVTLANEELGIPVELMYRLPTRAVRDVGNTNVQTLVCMYQQVCSALLKAQPKLLDWVPEERVEEAKPEVSTTTAAERQKNLQTQGENRVKEQKETLIEKLKREKAEREALAKATKAA